MENQGSPNNPGTDEIDLRQLLQVIGKGFNNMFRAFLRLFLYLKRSILKLVILAVVGLLVGFGLNQIVTKRLKTEVIVKPNLESKNYLYDVVAEIQANVRARDTSFFGEMEIDVEDLRGFEIDIAPVEDFDKKGNLDDDLKYLELLEKFRGDDIITDVVRTEILNKSALNHRITFYYKIEGQGKIITEKLLSYINSNAYFNELVAINRGNAEERIRQNQNLVEQIDGLVTKYSEKMSRDGQRGEAQIVLDNEEQLDIPGLLGLKNGLIRDIERKKIELQSHKEAIRIINIGKTQEVQKSFFGKNIVLIPSVLILLFILIDIIKFLNRKSKEMQLQ